MRLNPQDHAWAVRQVPLFQHLDEDSLQTLMANFRHRVVRRGQAIFLENDPGSSLFVLLSGRAQVEKGSGDDVRVVKDLGAGEIIGEMALLEGGNRTATVRIVEDARLLELPRDSFVRCIRRSPEFALRILAALTKRLREFTEESVQLTGHQVMERLAAFLENAATVGEATPRLTNAEIAQRIGTTRESANRGLRRLEAAGIIARPAGEPKRYVVLDVERLRQFCISPPPRS